MQKEDVKYLAVHCSATPPEMDIGVDEIRQWHKDKGWSDVGYHYVIRRDGTVEGGRPQHKQGAHVHGWNDKSLGICLIGGVDGQFIPEDNFTAAQKQALYGLLEGLLGEYPGAQIKGHRDFPGVKKACPSFDVQAWFEAEKEVICEFLGRC